MKAILKAGALAVACAATIGSATVPVFADTASTAAIAAAAGAIVGTLLFDSSGRPYYVRGGRHVYVSEPVAQYYVQRRDPGFYRAHRSDWQHNRRQFARAWQRNHH